MALDPRIILAGQPVNVLGAMSSANQMAAQQGEFRHQNALRSMLQENGPGIMAGDQNALSQLSRFDPNAAFGIKADQERLRLARAAAARAAAASKDKERLRAELAQATNGLKHMAFALRSGDERAWSQMSAAFGAPGLPMDANSFALLASTVQGLDEGMRSGMVEAVTPAQPKMTDDMREFQYAQENPAFGEFLRGNRAAGATRIENTIGGSPEMPGLSKLGEGYTYLYDENGRVRLDEMGRPLSAPIPGSKAARDAQAAALEAAQGEAREANSARQKRLRLGTTLESINLNIQEIENGGLPVTGAAGDLRRTWLGRAITGDSAVDFQTRSDQVTNAAALAEVQNMRDNSKTGGAVGQLTDSERVALGQSVTAMNSAGTPEEYIRAAKAYRKLALDLAYGEGFWRLDPATNEVIVSPPASDTPQDAPQGVDPSVWQYMTPQEKALWK